MELEFETRTTAFLRQSIEGVCRQEQTQEVIVPDTSPDASRVVYCCAQAVVRSREGMNGAVQITGGVQAAALYQTEDDDMARTLEAWIPFTLRLEHPAAKEDTQILMDCRVLAADARLVNSRKILFRVEVGAQIFGFAEDEIALPLLKETPKGLQLRCRSYPLPLPAETAERTYLVGDELDLPAGSSVPQTIVSAAALPEVTERRIVGNKAVFKGTMQLRTLYLTADGSVGSCTHTLPFSQYCQLSTDYDEDQLRLLTTVTSCDVTVTGAEDAPKLSASVGLLTQCLVTRTVTLTFCEDAFSTCGTLQPEWKEFQFDCQLDRQTQRLSVRDAIEGAALHSVIDSTAFVDFPRTEQTEQGLRVTVPVALRVLGTDADGALLGLSGAARAETELPANPGARCTATAVQCPGGYASPGADGAEARYELTLDAEVFARQTLRTLSGGTIEPPAAQTRRPSLIIRPVPAALPVWEVAKQYGTSVASVCAANGLTGDEIEAGTLLLIPME